jgi:hypothetical protein
MKKITKTNNPKSSTSKDKRAVYVKPDIEEEEKLESFTLACDPPPAPECGGGNPSS